VTWRSNTFTGPGGFAGRRSEADALGRGAHMGKHTSECHYGLMPVWLIWLILAGVFAGGEAVSGTFVLLMMSGGALAGAITAAAGGPFLLQVIVALIGTLGLLWLVRPVAIRHLNPGPAAITGTDALVGREAVVMSAVTRDDGRVRLNGAEWSARAKDPTQELPAGTRVSVIAIDGATAVVWKDPHPFD
jgi:membrane protein implicated in regulation of membrane protease activity